MSELEEASVRAARQRERLETAETRRERGVVHTPIEVARWGLGKVQDTLRQEFALPDGLADGRVCVLDPAVGTGVWLAAALQLTRGRRAQRSMLGFDVDAAALVTSRSVLDDEAREQEVQLDLRCLNTLEVADPWPADSKAVRVMVGNPPWAARSASRGSALSDLWLREFRRDAQGAALGERRTGVLSDDYVRFFRWALEQARTAPAGAILCFASNVSFVDGPVHRGMRAALCAAFDRIEVLDLGGNALLSRGEARDENVFGVRVGAAVTVAVRLPGARQHAAQVGFRRLAGSRAQKLSVLASGDTPCFSLHTPAAPWFHFRPRTLPSAEEGFWLNEAFPFHREGVQTNRDQLAIDVSEEALRQRLLEVSLGRHDLPEARHFSSKLARHALAEALERDPDSVTAQLAYRPLDTRFVCTVAPLCHRPRPELLRAAARSSLLLLSVRKDRGDAPFSLFASSRHVADACFLSTRSSCRTRVFPSHDAEGAPNLSEAVAERFGALLGRVSPELVIEYVLGVLGSRLYRERQGEALKLDYPRVPWPSGRQACEAAITAGRALSAALDPELSDEATDRLLLHLPPEEPLSAAGLVWQDATVRSEGRLILSGVLRAAWDLQVGHHTLRRTALTRVSDLSAGRLYALMCRAFQWLAAMDRSDDAVRAHFGR